MQSPAVDTMDKYNENLTDVKEIFRKGDLRAIPKPLLKWYDNNRRILPWREQPTPYRVWVSEIMLQQTRVEAVKPYFQRFMDTLPDIAALAEAPEETLLKLWEDLVITTGCVICRKQQFRSWKIMPELCRILMKNC